ncbi:MAG TPA: hypothetical protein VLT16_16380 [Candidatus Limnocylindrales bacterium]|nr:hypothetical protein [Candidatus Limnocylindrales bacterium]
MKFVARISWQSAFALVLFMPPAFAQQPAPAGAGSPSGKNQTAASSGKQASPAGQPHPAAALGESAADTPALPPVDPKEIVRRSVETDHRTLDIARNYTCQQHEIIRHLGKHGETKSTDSKTFDVNFYYGQEYSRLVQVDDKPLSEKDQKKEDEKLEKFLAKYRDESDADREKRLEKERKQREEGRAFVRDVVNAYNFRLLGEEKVDGVDSYVIEATPRPDFKPTQPHADMLKKMKGRLWIEKKDYNWVKVEAEATDTISFGLFLFRIHPGSRFVLEKTLVNNEVWLLKRLDIDGGARIALFKNANIQQEDVFSKYRKFVTSVKILPKAEEVKEGPK